MAKSGVSELHRVAAPFVLDTLELPNSVPRSEITSNSHDSNRVRRYKLPDDDSGGSEFSLGHNSKMTYMHESVKPPECNPTSLVEIENPFNALCLGKSIVGGSNSYKFDPHINVNRVGSCCYEPRR